MESKSAGRNTKLKIEEVNLVIQLFRKNEKPMGTISYSEIWEYANHLYTEGIVSNSTSDSFWRKKGRLGRKRVDQANEIFSAEIPASKGKKVKVPNVVDLVDKKYKKKDELLKQLIYMENDFHEALEREKKLEDELLVLQDILQKTKTTLNQEQDKNKGLQSLVYRLYRISTETTNPEVEQKTDYAMKTMFKTPTAFFEFEKENKPKISESALSESKILPFDSDQKKKFSSRFRK
ncbi:hypothetical protein [Peribacillus deserti]|uniref:Uncharacterized protein n=1 Tax=Peribacillus deserti TaxID=673318 RepID=A0A2N5M804_9BACI|nr:hypothetical protein [Peribacillus deserti]PLT30508.1 hypothetical protein CUU66_07565 [Peribacillus deserti]